MARKKPKPEKGFTDQILAAIGLPGFNPGQAAGKNGLIKRLSGRILRRALDAPNLWFVMAIRAAKKFQCRGQLAI